MILTQTNIDEFEEAFEELAGADAAEEFYWWLANNPQIPMPSFFHEFVGAHQLSLIDNIVQEYGGT